MLWATAGAAHADGVAAGVSVGTLGLGPEFAFPVRENINVRVGFQWLDFNHATEYHSVNYDTEVSLLNVPVDVDWFPAHGIFRLTAGLAFSQNKLDAEGRPQSGVYTIGNNNYSATQIGSVKAETKYNAFAPYLGVGWGNPVRPGKKFGWNVDVGLLYLGSPKTTYTVTCGTGVNCAQLQADASIESGNFNDDVSRYKLYPVGQFYVTWQF